MLSVSYPDLLCRSSKPRTLGELQEAARRVRRTHTLPANDHFSTDDCRIHAQIAQDAWQDVVEAGAYSVLDN